MARAGVDVRLEHEGGWLDLGDGVALWVLWPPAGGFADENLDNENSLVTKLVYGDLSVLLTGDAGLPSEAAWIARQSPVASTVLKVGHHGSHSATSAELVQAVQPSVAVIQVGADNDYGHPHDDVLARLDGLLTLRTDRQGRIHLYSDGRRMWIETEKKR
jgi:competence protein ComEC